MPVYTTNAALPVYPQTFTMFQLSLQHRLHHHYIKIKFRLRPRIQSLSLTLSPLERVDFFTGSLFLIGPNTTQMFPGPPQHLPILFHAFIILFMKIPWLTRCHCLLYFQVFFSFPTWHTSVGTEVILKFLCFYVLRQLLTTLLKERKVSSAQCQPTSLQRLWGELLGGQGKHRHFLDTSWVLGLHLHSTSGVEIGPVSKRYIVCFW